MKKDAADTKKLRVRNLVFTWSNLISASRLIISFPIVYLHYINGQQVSWIIILLVMYGIGSDFLDGYVARTRDAVSELGKILDPIADKLTAFVLFAYVVLIDRVPLWFFIVEIVRDLLILSGSIYIRKKHKKVPMAVTSGKVSVNALAAYWVVVFFFPDALPIHLFFMGVSLALMVYSFFDYLQRFINISKGADFN